MQFFKATIQIIGVNPFVLLPEKVLNNIFAAAGKNKGPVPVKGMVNKHPFTQTLVKYSGEWRLYINGPMLKGSNTKVGDRVEVSLDFDDAERTTPMHPTLAAALQKNQAADNVFKKLPPSRQKEIMRYINHLKTETAVDTNVTRAIAFLTGRSRFIGREKP